MEDGIQRIEQARREAASSRMALINARPRLLKRNVVLLRVIRAIEFFMLMIPILVVYYKANGLTMQEVMLLQAIFSVTMVVIEIPSGYFSDVLGRRRTMIIGCTLTSVGFAIYPFVFDFMGFLVVELVLGMGMAFISGTDSAMLYDTMLELGHPERGIKEEGRQLSFGHFSEALSGVLGGFLAALSLRTPLLAQGAVMLSLIPLAFLLTEPQEHRRDGRRGSMREILDIVSRVVVHDKGLRGMLLTSSALGASTLTFVWLLQPYLLNAGVPVWLFGAVWSSLMLIVGMSAMHAHRVQERFGTLNTITVLGALVICVYIVAGTWSSLWVIPLLVIFNITRGVSNPVFTTAINQRVESHQRATVLSVRGLGVRMLFVMIGPLVGWITDVTSLSMALYSCAIIFGTTFFVCVFLWRRALS